MEPHHLYETTEETLRSKLRNQLEESGMTSALQKMVRQICKSKSDLNEIDPDEVVQEVYRKGLMKEFMENLDEPGKTRENAHYSGQVKTIYRRPTTSEKELESESSKSEDDPITKILRKSGKYYLKVEILGGKAFLDNLLEEDDVNAVGGINNSYDYISGKDIRAQLKLHVLYKSQRFSSKSVESRVDPEFKEEFLVEIGRFHDVDDGSIPSKLLGINEPLRIMVVREDINLQVLGGSTVAYCVLDWRSILITENGSKNFPLELMGIGPQHSVCIGILNTRLSLIPSPRRRLAESTYLDKVNDEIATQEDFQRRFIAFAKRWWMEYIEIRADHQLRLVRLFAYDEKMNARPVMTFVKRVILDDLLVTPFQAAWFVALLPTNENNYQHYLSDNHDPNKGNLILPGIQNGTGGCFLSERWQGVDSTIVSKSGTAEDHAVLLTSIFLSFGLDAYVALGTKKGKGSWAWTVTLSESQEPTCWESTTGDYYEHYSSPEATISTHRVSTDVLNKLTKNRAYNFLTISCLFNNEGLYANVQPNTSIDYTDWDLENPSKWKYLSYTNFQRMMPLNPVKLSGVTFNWEFHTKKLEFQLKNLIACSRKEKHLRTKWDDHLSQFMGQHLVREEMQVSTGGFNFKDYFTSVATRKLLPGYDLRAHTFHSRASEGYLLFTEALEESQAQEIIFAQGDDVKHSIKVKIFPYPEDVPSIRFMISCQYISTG